MSRTDAQRAAARDYMRRKRAAALAERMHGAATCPHRTGARGVCGGRLEYTTDGDGRVHAACPRCARRVRGICRDCPAPVAGQVGRALRCATCKRLAQRQCSERYKVEHRRTVNAKARKYARTKQAEKIEYNRLWRALRPSKKAQYAKQYRERHADRLRAYRRAYYAAHGDTRRTGAHLCMDGCGTTLTSRAKRCDACRVARRRDARMALSARLASAERAA